jgi:hypothetical protein
LDLARRRRLSRGFIKTSQVIRALQRIAKRVNYYKNP